LGDLDGFPLLTFTAPWALDDIEPTSPSAAYLTMLGRGLMEAHPMSALEAGEYLASLPGAADSWMPAEIAELL